MDFLSIYNSRFKQVINFILPLINVPYFKDKSGILKAFFKKNNYNDEEIIITLPIEDESLYKDFENKYLIKNNYLIDYKKTETHNIYIMSTKHVTKDINLIKDGLITNLSEYAKRKIHLWHSERLQIKRYDVLDHFFEPKEISFRKAAKELGVDVEDLKSVGQLCPKILIENETFTEIL